HDHDVLRDGGRRVETNLAGLEIDLLALPEDGASLEVDDATLAEGLDHRAVLRVERDQTIARRHVEDAFVAFAVGPVGDAAAGELPGRDRGPIAFAITVRPPELAGLSVKRDD